jgi:two-component system sensor histidine kinase/response regulator
MKENFKNITPTILVVDDNPKNIQIVALILREFKYKIIIAVNGQNAIDLVNRTRPDLILLDVMMPGMDGFEACKIIKSDEKNDNIPIIFLTALSEKVKIVKGFEMGGVDYIVKPFNKDELITRIKTHLELKFTRDKLNKTTSNLIELNRIKDKMFSIIGHDLRSPVGSMKMMLDLILCDPVLMGLKEHKNNFEVLSQTVNELYLLIDNLLGWARAQSGNLGFVNENIELAMAVNSVFLLSKIYSFHPADYQLPREALCDQKAWPVYKRPLAFSSHKGILLRLCQDCHLKLL